VTASAPDNVARGPYARGRAPHPQMGLCAPTCREPSLMLETSMSSMPRSSVALVAFRSSSHWRTVRPRQLRMARYPVSRSRLSWSRPSSFLPVADGGDVVAVGADPLRTLSVRVPLQRELFPQQLRLTGPRNRCPFEQSPSCVPAGPSCNEYSGPTVAKSRKPQRSCSASWQSPAPTSAQPTGWPERSSTLFCRPAL
jgi:hypothetical protein